MVQVLYLFINFDRGHSLKVLLSEKSKHNEYVIFLRVETNSNHAIWARVYIFMGMQLSAEKCVQ